MPIFCNKLSLWLSLKPKTLAAGDRLSGSHLYPAHWYVDASFLPTFATLLTDFAESCIC